MIKLNTDMIFNEIMRPVTQSGLTTIQYQWELGHIAL